ncbi:MAG: hypothetical protein M1839_001909 [Geoglossum umbratile]|nr:MAG: hypothetical protein M1839_001909 [Geoglossum umbratile]
MDNKRKRGAVGGPSSSVQRAKRIPNTLSGSLGSADSQPAKEFKEKERLPSPDVHLGRFTSRNSLGQGGNTLKEPGVLQAPPHNSGPAGSPRKPIPNPQDNLSTTHLRADVITISDGSDGSDDDFEEVMSRRIAARGTVAKGAVAATKATSGASNVSAVKLESSEGGTRKSPENGSIIQQRIAAKHERARAQGRAELEAIRRGYAMRVSSSEHAASQRATMLSKSLGTELVGGTVTTKRERKPPERNAYIERRKVTFNDTLTEHPFKEYAEVENAAYKPPLPQFAGGPPEGHGEERMDDEVGPPEGHTEDRMDEGGLTECHAENGLETYGSVIEVPTPCPSTTTLGEQREKPMKNTTVRRKYSVNTDTYWEYRVVRSTWRDELDPPLQHHCGTYFDRDTANRAARDQVFPPGAAADPLLYDEYHKEKDHLDMDLYSAQSAKGHILVCTQRVLRHKAEANAPNNDTKKAWLNPNVYVVWEKYVEYGEPEAADIDDLFGERAKELEIKSIVSIMLGIHTTRQFANKAASDHAMERLRHHATKNGGTNARNEVAIIELEMQSREHLKALEIEKDLYNSEVEIIGRKDELSVWVDEVDLIGPRN